MIYTLHNKFGAAPLPGDVTGETRFDNLTAVPEFVAPLAALFPPLWLIFHRLWLVLSIYIGVMIILLSLLATQFAPAVLLLSGLPGIYLFLEGHQLRRHKLFARGFEMVGVVEAPDKHLAVEKYLYRWEEQQHVTKKEEPQQVTKKPKKTSSGSSTIYYPQPSSFPQVEK